MGNLAFGGFGGRKFLLTTIAIFITFSLLSFGVFAVPAHPSADCWKTKTCPADIDQPAEKASIQKLPPRLHSVDSPALPVDGSKGKQKLLVIPVTFSDITPYTDIADMETELQGLVDYYKEVSYGKLELEIVFASADWIDLGETMAWYGEDMEDEIDPYTLLMFEDAIAAVDADVDFNDFEHILVLHADRDQAAIPSCTDCIWSSRITFGEPIVTYDGAIINGAFTVAEIKRYSDPEFSMGTAAHELAHDIISPLTGRGAYDLYNVLTGLSVVEDWSLMDSGSWLNPPAHLDPLHKRLYEWTSDAEIQVPAGESRIITLKPSADNPNFLTVIGSNTEAFLVENRVAKGFDAALPEEGVLIWHFDTINLFVGNLFNALDPPGLALETLSTISDAAFEDGETFKNPLSDLNDGTTTGIVIDQIKRTGDDFNFRINNNDTTPPVMVVIPLPSITNSPSAHLEVATELYTVSCTYSRLGETVEMDKNEQEDRIVWTAEDTLEEGTTEYVFECKDAAENSAKSEKQTVQVDLTAPTLDLLSPSETSTTKEVNIQLSTDSDVVACTYIRAGVEKELAFTDEGWVGSDTLEEGNNNLNFVCTDKAGNAGSLSHTVLVDTVPPVFTIESPIKYKEPFEGITTDKQVSIVLKTDEELSSCSYINKEGMKEPVELEEGEGEWTGTDSVEDGILNYAFFCTDSAGNVHSEYRIVFVDSTPPSITVDIVNNTVLAPSNPGLFRRLEVSVTDRCVDIDSAQVFVDGKEVPVDSKPQHPFCFANDLSFGSLNLLEFEEGEHTLEFVAKDMGGLETRDVYNVSFSRTYPSIEATPAEEQRLNIQYKDLFSFLGKFKIDAVIGSLFQRLDVMIVSKLFGSGGESCKTYDNPGTADIEETLTCSKENLGLGGPQFIIVKGEDTFKNKFDRGVDVGLTVYNAPPNVQGSDNFVFNGYTHETGYYPVDVLNSRGSLGWATEKFGGSGPKLWNLSFSVDGSKGSSFSTFVLNPEAIPTLGKRADMKDNNFTGKFSIFIDGKELKEGVKLDWSGAVCDGRFCEPVQTEQQCEGNGGEATPVNLPWVLDIDGTVPEDKVTELSVLFETPTVKMEKTAVGFDPRKDKMEPGKKEKLNYLFNISAPNQFYSEDGQELVFALVKNISRTLPDGSVKTEELSGNYSLADMDGTPTGKELAWCTEKEGEKSYTVCYAGFKYSLGDDLSWTSGNELKFNFTADIFSPVPEAESKPSGGGGANAYKATAFVPARGFYKIPSDQLPGFSGASGKKVIVDGRELSSEEWKEGSVEILDLEEGVHEIEVQYTVPTPSAPSPSPSGGGGGGGFVTPP